MSAMEGGFDDDSEVRNEDGNSTDDSIVELAIIVEA